MVSHDPPKPDIMITSPAGEPQGLPSTVSLGGDVPHFTLRVHTRVQTWHALELPSLLMTKHPNYAILTARIAMSNLHKETKRNFSHVIGDLYNYGLFSLKGFFFKYLMCFS